MYLYGFCKQVQCFHYGCLYWFVYTYFGVMTHTQKHTLIFFCMHAYIVIHTKLYNFHLIMFVYFVKCVSILCLLFAIYVQCAHSFAIYSVILMYTSVFFHYSCVNLRYLKVWIIKRVNKIINDMGTSSNFPFCSRFFECSG